MSGWVDWMEFELQRQNLRNRIYERYVNNEMRITVVDQEQRAVVQHQPQQQQQQQQQHQQQQQQSQQRRHQNGS